MPVLQQSQQLGPYVVEGLLGRGGMAEVYRATHRTLEREVAIKVINPALNVDPTFPLRFLREAKAVARLHHPNIVTVYDFGEEGELNFLVMELATGGTFRQQVRRFQTLQEAVAALTPIGEAIAYAHGRGVVHRDIKPANVLIDEDARPLLADFGLARIATESLDLTATGVGIGSPHYTPPEQALGQRIDHRADIYAFGIVTYEVLSGHLPYDGPTPFAVVRQQIEAPPPSLRAVLPAAPERLERAIKRATAKQPADRFDNLREFLSELRLAAGEAPDLPVGRGDLGLAAGASQAGLPTAIYPGPAADGVETMDKTAVLPDSSADGGITPEPLGAAATQHGGGRRATSLSEIQVLSLATAFVIVVFINAVGLWLTLAGRAAAGGNVAGNVMMYVFDHLAVFKSALTGLAFVLAGFATFAMRYAVVEDHEISTEAYRRLRQYHRMVGYMVVTIILAIGLLTCFGIFGFGMTTPHSAIYSLLGMTLLVVLGTKLAIIRYFPSQRRHLKLLGESVFLLVFLSLATSTVPALWSHFAGAGHPGSSPYGYLGGNGQGRLMSLAAQRLGPVAEDVSGSSVLPGITVLGDEVR